MNQDIVLVKEGTVKSRLGYGFNRIHAISPETAETNRISMQYLILPTGAESIPHAHKHTYTAVYIVSGSVKVYYGEQLEKSFEASSGDFIYIPPNVIHYPVNEAEEDMVAIVARTPSVHEVVEYEELAEKVEGIHMVHEEST